MTVLNQREGVSALKVLAEVAKLEINGEDARQKDIVENTTLSKGSVSNNCKKLIEEELLTLEDDFYRLNQEKLLEHYRTHFEDYLRRRELPEGFKHYNDIRTATKKRMNDIFDGEVGKLIQDLLVNILSTANQEGQINRLYDIFNRVDRSLEKIAEELYNSHEDSTLRENLMMMVVSMDRTPEYGPFLEDIDLKNTTVYKMSEELKEVDLDA